ncbi:hypothetical protein Ahy_B04g071071 [Arachis hypogaea]|uniref:Uncharacterized protein n=1 Tax=Arachis hypogaea TaxID=3818 RepID=A0A444ZJZ6_ARAHY|nr:hypothetical protein Ahy_B04g071071 [Arachis hypogaea]
MANAVKEVHDVAEQQVAMTQGQVESAERQVSVVERQVAMAEKGLTIMQQNRLRLFSELDVSNMLTELDLMQYYQFLCENEQKKRQFFGISPEMRLHLLFYFTTAACVRLGDMES